MEEIDVEELFNKEFYIVDCYSFIFYPRVIRTIGFEISPDETLIITNILDSLTKENIKYSIEYLEKYKSFEKTKKEAERLNNLPKNKKRAEDWNSSESIYKRMLFLSE